MSNDNNDNNTDNYHYSSLYNKYDKTGKEHLNKQGLQLLLSDIGIRMDATDISRFLYFFNFNRQNGYLSFDNFSIIMKLSDFEIDHIVEKIKNKILFSLKLNKNLKIDEGSDILNDGSSCDNINKLLGHGSSDLLINRLKANGIVSSVFKIINTKVPGILSLGKYFMNSYTYMRIRTCACLCG